MSKTTSGKEVLVILTKHFGFVFVSQKGSHAKLRKQTDKGKVTTIVPMHHELAYGTLRGILELAKVDFEEFTKFL
ncbi:MAG: type II toxin-antitoxin system HicA family toxin [bacterium]|nr:type II toxin-antitoxin system HicA family toxin [bacterium]